MKRTKHSDASIDRLWKRFSKKYDQYYGFEFTKEDFRKKADAGYSLKEIDHIAEWGHTEKWYEKKYDSYLKKVHEDREPMSLEEFKNQWHNFDHPSEHPLNDLVNMTNYDVTYKAALAQLKGYKEASDKFPELKLPKMSFKDIRRGELDRVKTDGKTFWDSIKDIKKAYIEQEMKSNPGKTYKDYKKMADTYIRDTIFGSPK